MRCLRPSSCRNFILLWISQPENHLAAPQRIDDKLSLGMAPDPVAQTVAAFTRPNNPETVAVARLQHLPRRQKAQELSRFLFGAPGC